METMYRAASRECKIVHKCKGLYPMAEHRDERWFRRMTRPILTINDPPSSAHDPHPHHHHRRKQKKYVGVGARRLPALSLHDPPAAFVRRPVYILYALRNAMRARPQDAGACETPIDGPLYFPMPREREKLRLKVRHIIHSRRIWRWRPRGRGRRRSCP